jgi:hypothetical protein
MGKIYRRSTLVAKVAPKKKDEKARKRNVIVNFRVSPEEKKIIDNRIALSGLPRGQYFINSSIHNEIHTTGNIRTFDEIKKQLKRVDEHLCSISSVDELDLERLESLRAIVEILNSIYREEE